VKTSKAIVTRARLVLATFVIAVLALTTALAFAQQDHAPAAGHAPTAAPHAAAPVAPAEGAAAHGEHGDAASVAHAGHHGPDDLNVWDIWDKKRPALVSLFINFGVLMTLYYMLGKKPISNALKQRRVTIGKEMDEAQKLFDEAKERAKKYQGNLKVVDVDAATAKSALIAAGTGEVERLLVEAQEKSDRMKRDADRLVQQERKAVHQALLEETIDLATAEATQLLQKVVTVDDHARLAQDLLLELARRPAARGAASPKVSAPPAAPPPSGVPS
jgi:F0F1-type ATP synthase membrane subunit b/b'